MPFLDSLQLLWKFSELRDEAARGVALLPQINAALEERIVYKKLELFAPIASEVCSILASGVKDLNPDLAFGSASEDEKDELRAVYAALGINLDRFMEFLANTAKLVKELAEEVAPYLPYILPFLGNKKNEPA